MTIAPDIRDRLTLPAFCAPMFLCSNVDLAVESCKAGIVGSITSSPYRTIELFERDMTRISEALAKVREQDPDRKIGPLAVNVPPNKNLEEYRRYLEICARHDARIIVTSAADPRQSVAPIHDLGMLHLHDVTNIRFAELAANAGVDGLVAIGAGGGGHAGTISHLALLPKIRAMFEGTIVMAGAVSNGAAIRAAEILGADLAYLGTRFIASCESAAPHAYKEMLVAAGVEDVVYTRGVNGMPASWLKASLRQAGLDPDNLFLPEGRSTEHLPEGKKPWRDIWSGGQGVGLIDDIPKVADLVQQLRREYVAACRIPDMVDAAMMQPV